MKTKAAGLALVTLDGLGLFLKRAPGHDCPHTWSFPGGMLETNEPPLIGAIRETREETGFIAPEDAAEPKLMSDGWYAIFKQRIGSHFIPTLDHENLAYAWAPLESPPEPLHPGLKETLSLIAKDSAMPMVTTPNAGMPAFAGTRKRLEEAMETADDMTPEGWRGLVNGLMEFFAEEAAEPDHAADAEPKSLYVHRPLKNAADIVTWARKAGFAKTLAPADMHVTVAYSKEPMAWPEFPRGDVRTDGGERTVEALGDEGAIVLKFQSEILRDRWQELRDKGASWDHAAYNPHVTITYEPGDVDLSKIEPYDGPLEFGPEKFEEIKQSYEPKHAQDRDTRNPEHEIRIAFNGDFQMGEFVRALWWLGSAGASRGVEVAPGDAETQRMLTDKGYRVKFGWDGDGADKILTAELDGKDILKTPTQAKDAAPHDNGEKLTERDRQQIGRVGSEHREEMPGGAFLMPASRKYPVKEKQGGDWAYSRKLLVAAAREARMHGHESLADRADTIRKREFGGAEDENGLTVDAEHDGPWMSCMASDGATMYRNKNVPSKAEILGKTVDVDARLKKHEAAEWEALQQLLTSFREEKGREPDQAERELIYKLAHHGAGVPAERELVSKEDGDGGKAWNAWCRGIETKIEKGPFSNEPDDADVRPIPHTHNELEATVDDCAMDGIAIMALDRESVRSFDKDGRMRVAVAHISKACVNPYRGKEIPNWQGLGLDPNKVYHLLRDPEELRKAAPTFNGIQILQRHIPVSVDDHKAWDIIGTTGTDARFEAPFLDNSLYFWTKDSIEDIETERKKELSCGYHYTPDFTTTGWYVDEEGKRVHYDGVMRGIAGNHLALVRDGRAGDDVVVGDSLEDMQWSIVERELLSMAAAA